MKIWVIGRGYPMPKNQLQGSFELEQAKMLAGQGHEVCYVALVFHPRRCVHKWGDDQWQENGVNVFIRCVRSLPGRFRVEFKPYRKAYWESFLALVTAQMGTPDVIHVHYPAWISEPDALEGYRQHGAKIFVTEHWSKVLLQQLRPHEKRRLDWYMNHADAVAAVGEPLARSMRQITGIDRKITVIPNVVTPIFKRAPQKAQDGIARFITIGRLLPLRQYDQVIVAFDEVFHGRADVTLTLVGGGQDYQRLERLIHQRHAEGNISLVGMKSREECARLIANADCLICYSQYETFGVPIIEAWVCGIPVIVPQQLGFLDNASGEKLGISVDTQDSATLKRAMEQMILHKNQYDSDFIAQYAQEHFSEETVYQKLLGLYKS